MKHSANQRQQLTRYDQELRSAKNSGKLVTFDLATPTSFTDEEASVTGYVLEVDKFSVKIRTEEHDREVWLAKPMIVGTEVLR